MGLWGNLGECPGKDFPNHLLDDTTPAALPRRGLLLATLLLICFATRAWMAWNWDILCPDAAIYLETARKLEQGRLHLLLERFGLNIYPMILTLLHRAGLDWCTAGEWWSVLMASLAVLPLFGWLRRQFNDQVATLGCLLYALHAKLVFVSPLIIRDPTFWFLFQLVLYFGWRAIIEIRPRFFLATGIALTLAIHTRSEGLLLLIPLGLWSLWRRPAMGRHRVRLAAGMALCLAMIPAWVVLVNLTLLRNYPHWVLTRRGHRDVVESMLPSERKPAADVQRPEVTTPELVRPGAEQHGAEQHGAEQHGAEQHGAEHYDMTRRYARSNREPWLIQARKLGVRLVKAYTYLYIVLVLVGVCHWRRVFLRRDQQALFLLGPALCAMIWLSYSRAGGINVRYFYPCLLIAFGYLALGLLGVAQWISQRTERLVCWNSARRTALVAGMLLAIQLAGIPERSVEGREFVYQRVELGKWILERSRPGLRIAGCLGTMQLVAYYAEGSRVHTPDRREYLGESLVRVIRTRRPDIVVLLSQEEDHSDIDDWREIVAAHPELDFRCVPQDRLPPRCQDTSRKILVLVRIPRKYQHRAALHTAPNRVETSGL